MGAPEGTKNGSWRHGLRASALPKDCSYIDGQVRVFRRYVQNLLAERDGAVSFYQEAVLQSAVRHEQRTLLLARWLRLEGDHHGALPVDVEEKTETPTKRKALSVMERVALLRDISVATEMRDKCLQRLDLHQNLTEEPMFDGLLALPPQEPAPAAAQPPQSENGTTDTPEPPERTESTHRPPDGASHPLEGLAASQGSPKAGGRDD